MATAPKLVNFRPKPPRAPSPLTPELREFIDKAIVPALVNQYLAEMKLAKPVAGMRLFDNSTAVTLRG